MTNQEKIKTLKELAEKVSRHNIAGANNMLIDAEQIIRIMRSVPEAGEFGTPLFIEATSTIKQTDLLNLSAWDWSILKKPKKNTIETFVGIRNRIVSYTNNFAHEFAKLN